MDIQKKFLLQKRHYIINGAENAVDYIMPASNNLLPDQCDYSMGNGQIQYDRLKIITAYHWNL